MSGRIVLDLVWLLMAKIINTIFNLLFVNYDLVLFPFMSCTFYLLTLFSILLKHAAFSAYSALTFFVFFPIFGLPFFNNLWSLKESCAFKIHRISIVPWTSLEIPYSYLLSYLEKALPFSLGMEILPFLSIQPLILLPLQSSLWMLSGSLLYMQNPRPYPRLRCLTDSYAHCRLRNTAFINYKFLGREDKMKGELLCLVLIPSVRLSVIQWFVDNKCLVNECWV